MLNLDRTLERPGATLRLTVLDGWAQPVVFVHGAGMDHTMFAAQANALHDAGHKVVIFDLRGHGVSVLAPGSRFTAAAALDDLGAVLDHVGIEHPVLVGHSLGGNIAQALVRRDPDRIAALIVVDATWNTGPLSRGERVALLLAAPALSLIPASQLPGVLARASAVTPHAIAAIETVFAKIPKRVFLDVWRATVAYLEPDPDYRVPISLGLVRGELDRTGNISAAMPAWATAEGVRERVIPGAGHVVTLDAPEAVTTALFELLAEASHG